MFTVTRYHDISAGHRVWGHESKCANLHGHNYRIFFTVAPTGHYLPKPTPTDVHQKGVNDGTTITGREGQLDQAGRVIDFSVIKSLLCEWLEENWDHKMLIYKNDPILAALCMLDSSGVCPVDFNPTAENMAAYLVQVVGPSVLPSYVQLISCTVEETRKCSATYGPVR